MKIVKELLKAGANFNSKQAVKTALSLAEIEEESIEKGFVEFKNQLNLKDFKKIPAEDRILFLPHCLRDLENCEAEQTEHGLDCPGTSCGKCEIGALQEEAESKGYEVFIVPGSSLLKKIVKEKKPKGVIGVACYEEVEAGLNAMDENGITTQAVLLSKGGCVNTEVDANKVREKINLGLEDSEEEKEKEKK